MGAQEPEAIRDTVWMDQQDKLNQTQTAHLEGQLKGYKQNLVKESIRVSKLFLSSYSLYL
jgi:COP9 signalosome complex subunit 1